MAHIQLIEPQLVELTAELESLRQAARLALDALELIAVDVATTPNAYEAQRQAIAALRERGLG